MLGEAVRAAILGEEKGKDGEAGRCAEALALAPLPTYRELSEPCFSSWSFPGG